MRTSTLFASTFALACLAACGGGGAAMSSAWGDPCTTPGYLCSTASCSQFPTTPGCSFVMPTSGLCPFSAPHCWDPTTSKDYCPTDHAVCAVPRTTCPAQLCTRSDVAACSDAVMTAPFCTTPSQCIEYGCGATDMGAHD